LLSRRADHGAFERWITIAENRDISARNPTLGAQRSSNSIDVACGNIWSGCKMAWRASIGFDASGFDTFSCIIRHWSQSATVRDKAINGLPESYRGKMASNPPLLD